MTNHYTVVIAEAGSHLYGTNLEGSDSDTMGIAIGTAIAKLGTNNPEQWGQDDHVVYELAKYVRLALNGNPTVLQLLYTPKSKWLQWTPEWGKMQLDLRTLTVSERCRASFLGYLDGQRKKLASGRGQRLELVEKYGYDTKFAAHMVRLGIQGLEMVGQGQMALPMFAPHQKLCVDIRQGQFSQSDVLEIVEELEERLKTIHSVLPPKVDIDAVNKWMAKTYRKWWGHDTSSI